MGGLQYEPGRGATGRLGWCVVVAGVLLCVLGWFGVSGEEFAARQLPYLASATVPGAALIVAGAVLAAARGGRPAAPADRQEPLPDSPPSGPGWWAVPAGTLSHRADCPLVAGKADALRLPPAAVRERQLTACPICEPPPLPDPGDGGPAAPGTPPRGGVGAGDAPADGPGAGGAASPSGSSESGRGAALPAEPGAGPGGSRRGGPGAGGSSSGAVPEGEGGVGGSGAVSDRGSGRAALPAESEAGPDGAPRGGAGGG